MEGNWLKKDSSEHRTPIKTLNGGLDIYVLWKKMALGHQGSFCHLELNKKLLNNWHQISLFPKDVLIPKEKGKA